MACSDKLTLKNLLGFASKSKIKILCSHLDSNNILIAGTFESLSVLSEILTVLATREKDCGFYISPHGAGSTLFVKGSDCGIYFHRLPCIDNNTKHISDKYGIPKRSKNKS